MMRINQLLQEFLMEDIGRGDATMRVLFSGEERGRARIVARENLVLAGGPFARRIFQLLDSETEVKIPVPEGEKLKAKETIMEVSGRLVSLFSAERVALNLLQHLSGIATLTRSYVRELRGLRTVLLDTRKTNPGLRVLEKYAVRVGGGRNHRFGLDDGILIKSNHIRAAGGVAEAVLRAQRSAPHHLKIEVEVRNFSELEAAVGAGAELILLDNMRLPEIKKSLERFGDRVEFEVSGGVTRENIRRLAQTGVNFISSGAIIHSARWMNIAMEIME